MPYEYPFQNVNEHKKELVWAKGDEIPDKDPAAWRRDYYGSTMKFSEHGNTKSEFGWEIDHIIAVAAKGTDDISNLQPLQWENNRQKGDEYPPPTSL